MLFKNKEVSHLERVNQAKDRVTSALSMFTKAKEETINAKNYLNETINNIETEMNELENVKASALNEMENYDNLIKKFDEFTL